ncbi:allophanate hydrolase, partial [Staphylococcus pseudintermedius]
MNIIIEDSGLFSSFQDFGREGYEHMGVIRSGALDVLAHEIADRLINDVHDKATLEISNQMARNRFTDPNIITM